MQKHLVVDISAHGFGHVAQTSAVLNALADRAIKLSIRSLASEALLRERIRRPFTLIPYQQDQGMIMYDALRVNAEASFAWHAGFHRQYAQRLQRAQHDLADLKPDLLFANIPYLSLAAAAELQLPSIALCSLNWADIFKAYCGHYAGADVIHAEMHKAYASAGYFLQPTPAMPMTDLPNTHCIAPIAPRGLPQAAPLKQRLGLPAQAKFILVALGGIGMHYPLHAWPQLADVYWIFPDQALTQRRQDFIPQSHTQLSYIDLMASVDMVLTKIGYGTQTEAVVNQVPTLCVRRGDWPEEPYLSAWHQHMGEVQFIDWATIQSGQFVEPIQALLHATWTQAALKADGAEQAADYLMQGLAAWT